MISAYAGSAGMYASWVSVAAKSTDAYFFDGSVDAAVDQFYSASIKTVRGKLISRLFSKITTTSFSQIGQASFRSTLTGKYVSHDYGITLEGANWATNYVIGLGIGY